MDEVYDKIDLYILGKMSDEEKAAFESKMANKWELVFDVEKRRVLMIGMRAQEAEELYWQDQSERIDRYLLHDMTGDEVEAFEKQIKWDAELRSRFETQRLIMTVVRLNAAKKAIDKIETYIASRESLKKQLNREKDEARRRQQYLGDYDRVLFRDTSKSVAGGDKPTAPTSAKVQCHIGPSRSHKRRNILRLIKTFAAAVCLCCAIMTTGHFVGMFYGSKAFSVYQVALSVHEYEAAIKFLNDKIQNMEAALNDNPSIITSILQAKYELASLYLKNGEISKAKKVLREIKELGRIDSRSIECPYGTHIASELIEKASKLYNKLWWILW